MIMNPDNPTRCKSFYIGRCTMKEMDNYDPNDPETHKPIPCPFYKGDEYNVE
jgi:hypothetical protein